jgi:WD40 repeat protein
MMKKLIVLGIVALMGLSVAASAAVDAAWVIQLKASDLAGGASMTACQFGVAASPSSALLGANPGNAAEIYCPDLGGASPRWYKDIRTPVADGEIKVWNLILTAGSTYVPNQIKLIAWNPTGTAYDVDAGGTMRIWLEYNGQRIWEMDPTQNGTSAAPLFSYVFDYTNRQPISLKLVADNTPDNS